MSPKDTTHLPRAESDGDDERGLLVSMWPWVALWLFIGGLMVLLLLYEFLWLD